MKTIINKKSKINFLGGIMLTFFLLAVIIFILDVLKIISVRDLIYSGIFNTAGKYSHDNSKKSSEIIATVGSENIYGKDLDYEIQSYPLKLNDENKKLLVQKIIKDSIILQSAREDKLIKLENSIFNSLNKDYSKRIQTVKDIKSIIDNRRDTIGGRIIFIWFTNNKPGSPEYELGKQLALNKITLLQTRVKNKSISIEEASQEIMKDTSLKNIDNAYEINAITTFKAGRDGKITHDADFDTLIRSLDPSEVSPIYLLKDFFGGSDQKIDAAYAFAQVLEKRSGSNSLSFEKWYEQKKSKYEINIF